MFFFLEIKTEGSQLSCKPEFVTVRCVLQFRTFTPGTMEWKNRNGIVDV